MRNILSFHKKIGWKPGANTIAYYPLEKDGNDYSGNGHNLTWNSTPTYTTSGIKQVAYLGGNKIGVIANLSGTYTNYTFNVWCKPTNTNTWQEIFDNSVYSGNTNNVYLNFNGTGKELAGYSGFAYQYRPNGGSNTYQNIYETNNRGVNNWYNVVVTSTSSGIKVYVNGTQVASNSTTGTIVLSSGNNSIGARYQSGQGNVNFFSGYLSEFIMEDKTWTAEEVLDYYNNTKSAYIEGGWGPGENTVAYYPLKSDINDYSGNEHNLTVASGSVSYSNNMATVTRLTGSSILSGYNGDFTILAYTINTSGTECGFYPVADSSLYPIYSFGIISGRGIVGYCNSGTWYNARTEAGAIIDSNIHLLTGIKSGTTLTLYLDGIQVAQYTGAGTASTGPNLILGQNAVGSGTCTYGNLIVENRAWTQQEITDYYNKTKADYGL